MKFTTACRTALLACTVIGLTGCETMEESMSIVKEKISSLDFSLPSFHSTGSANGEGAQEVAGEASDCPHIEVINELKSVHQFLEGHSTRAEDLVSSIAMTDFKSSCKRNDTNIIVDLDINLEGKLGPKAQNWNTENPSFAYPYFIAITSPDGGIMAKEVFGVTVTYDKGQDHIVRQEHLRQIIPIQSDMASGQELLMGFQLTEAELAYNRALLGNQIPADSEAALNPHQPALVFSGDPALEPAKPKAAKKKPVAIIKPPQKPAAPVTAAAPAAPETPAPATTESAPAVESAAPATVTAPAAPAAAAAATTTTTTTTTAAPAATTTTTTATTSTPATPAATATGTAATAPAASGDAASAEDAPPAVEMLEEQTNAPEPPPIDDPWAIPTTGTAQPITGQ